MMHAKSSLLLSVALDGITLCPAVARADTFVTPFVGVAFGGDAEDTQLTYGGALTVMGRGAGLEVELGYSPEFFGEGSGIDIMTLMANYVAGGDVRSTGSAPYALVGIGLIRTDVEAVGNLVGGTENKVGFNLGVGLVSLFNRTFGVRGDIRYFRQVQAASEAPLVPVGDRLDFWRAVVGATLRF
jgi:opacity protein-like surface antigen